MECEKCHSKSNFRLIWNPDTGQYTCRDCAKPESSRVLHTNYIDYVQLEAKEIFLDKRKIRGL